MRIVLPLFLLSLAAAFLPVTPSGARETVSLLPAIRGLGQTMQKLQQKKALVVGYFGGSITEGAGASDASKTSWRARTTAYLRTQYPNAAITEVNAAIGGTGSDLGAFRCRENLLSHKPDLVFVEFAVNDGSTAETRTLRAMEGIVRQIWRADPMTDIVFVYTASKTMESIYAKNELPASVARHHRVAVYYGIPEIYVGKSLCTAVKRDHGGDWLALTKEGVHPNDAGYLLYTREITDFLEAHKANRPVSPAPLPVPLTLQPLENGHLVDTWTLPETRGWTKEAKTLSGRYPHYLMASTSAADVLDCKFTGDAIGLYWQIAPDSGDIEWSVDRSPWKRLSSWDKYAIKFTRANYTMLTDSLLSGPHELRLRVLPDHNPESTGTMIRVGALLVDSPAASVKGAP